MNKPADYREWHARRNSIAMSLCTAKHREHGETCGCYNGDEEPDAVHFSNCRLMVEAANEALHKIGVQTPQKETP